MDNAATRALSPYTHLICTAFSTYACGLALFLRYCSKIASTRLAKANVVIIVTAIIIQRTGVAFCSAFDASLTVNLCDRVASTSIFDFS